MVRTKYVASGRDGVEIVPRRSDKIRSFWLILTKDRAIRVACKYAAWSCGQVGEVVKQIDITYEHGRQWDPFLNMLKDQDMQLENEELTKPCMQADCGNDNLYHPKEG